MSTFRPCIDLHDGKVKQIVGGTLESTGGLKTNFVSERGAEYYAELYKNDNLPGGHVIMLGPGNEQAARSALNAYPGGLQLGGGITPENAPSFIANGANGVIVTSYVFKDGQVNEESLQRMVRAVGRERLILDLSCRQREGKRFIVTDRWQKFTDVEVNRKTLERLAESCAEFLIHAVDVEGKQSGVDVELLELMAEFSPIPATYAGGVGCMEDIIKIETAGKGKIDYTVGSALDIFGGNLSYKTLVSRGK